MHDCYNITEVIIMPDYKEMYFKLFRATEVAINILIKAQQECEEMYISFSDPVIKLTDALKEAKESESSD